MYIFSKKLLARILPVQWTQPTLTQNGSFWGNSMAVYCTTPDGGTRGDFSNPWRAFDPCSSPSYIGIGRNDERQSTLYIHIYIPIPIRLKGYSFYFPGYETESDWGGFGYYWMFGSNDDSSWVQLDYGTDAARRATTTRTVSTSTFYTCYMLQCKTKGGGHRDGLDISQIRLNADYEDFV